MCRSGATYWPSLLLGRVRVTPVSELVIVMLALATVAPVGSVTVPTMVASWANADVANAAKKKRMNRVARRATLLRLTATPKVSAYAGERDFICQPPECLCLGRERGTGEPAIS